MKNRTSEITQHLKALAVKPEDLSLMAGTHVKVEGENQLQLFSVLHTRAMASVFTHIPCHTPHTRTIINKISKTEGVVLCVSVCVRARARACMHTCSQDKCSCLLVSIKASRGGWTSLKAVLSMGLTDTCVWQVRGCREVGRQRLHLYRTSGGLPRSLAKAVCARE